MAAITVTISEPPPRTAGAAATRRPRSLSAVFQTSDSDMPSSVIAAMQYNATTRILTIIYRAKNRGRYRYFDIPAEEWAAFQAAPSKGIYLNTIFKERGYHYERVSDRRS